MVRSWNSVNSGRGRAKVFRTSWIDSGEPNYFHPYGEWGPNNNNAPHGGMGDPSGTTDGTGNNQPHNNMEPFAVVYIFKRTV